MIDELVPQELWRRIAPLLPPHPRRRHRHPGRLRVDDRAALAGVVYVLTTGITWRELPHAVCGCSGVTCWRRYRSWTDAGVWPAMHRVLQEQAHAPGRADPRTAPADVARTRAVHVAGHPLPHRTAPARRSASADR